MPDSDLLKIQIEGELQEFDPTKTQTRLIGLDAVKKASAKIRDWESMKRR